MVLSKSKYKRLESCGLSDYKMLSLEIEGVLQDVACKEGVNILDNICIATLNRVQERLMEMEGLEIKDDEYMIERYERIIELINNGEPHMAVAKLLADISALKA